MFLSQQKIMLQYGVPNILISNKNIAIYSIQNTLIRNKIILQYNIPNILIRKKNILQYGIPSIPFSSACVSITIFVAFGTHRRLYQGRLGQFIYFILF